MRYAARVDANHASISALLTQVGCSVFDTSAVGQGFPDLIAVMGEHTVLIEVKDGSLSPSRRTLTPAQKQFHASWKGKLHTVESADQALSLVAHYRKRHNA
jgi:hypothetical protein